MDITLILYTIFVDITSFNYSIALQIVRRSRLRLWASAGRRTEATETWRRLENAFLELAEGERSRRATANSLESFGSGWHS